LHRSGPKRAGSAITCIAGVTKGGKVWIGGDSAGVWEGDLSIQVRSDAKVFKNGEFLFGFCGSFRTRDITHYAFKPAPQKPKQTDHEYLCTTFIDSLRMALIKGGMKHEDNLLDPEGSFLLGYRGGLYSVEEDFQVGQTAVDFNAIGCGSAIALGALDVTPKKPPAIRIRHALEAAERWSAGVRGPFSVYSI
jgi:ATP-dependent protease HslVU (ClpYQ) peptidase subunit